MSQWTPEDYLDEVVPPPRDTPSDWIVGRDGDFWLLANVDGQDDAARDDEHSFRIRVSLGEVLNFAAFDDFGVFQVEIMPGGEWSCAREIPTAATHFCAPGDIDSLADTMDDFAQQYAEHTVGEVVDVAVYAWSDPVAHRLVVENGAARFVAVEPEVAAHG